MVRRMNSSVTVEDKGRILTSLQIGHIGAVILPPALCFPKLSVVMLYLRIFSVGRWFSIAAWTMLVINIGWGVSFTLVSLFQCQPIYAGWSTTLGPNGWTCLVVTPFNNAFAASTLFLIFDHCFALADNLEYESATSSQIPGQWYLSSCWNVSKK